MIGIVKDSVVSVSGEEEAQIMALVTGSYPELDIENIRITSMMGGNNRSEIQVTPDGFGGCIVALLNGKLPDDWAETFTSLANVGCIPA